MVCKYMYMYYFASWACDGMDECNLQVFEPVFDSILKLKNYDFYLVFGSNKIFSKILYSSDNWLSIGLEYAKYFVKPSKYISISCTVVKYFWLFKGMFLAK